MLQIKQPYVTIAVNSAIDALVIGLRAIACKQLKCKQLKQTVVWTRIFFSSPVDSADSVVIGF
ncbi:hypothetical protein NG799_19785 [Laspinema sp. D1]|uniref:Uncharacterized protein n=1 Tax=Laspinema palackyanum D2a TaxID=2953684 RepID=A0ABT2MV17_9CYAN|nr:hypothetical protein [Laspinema sp. D2a]